MKRIRTWNVSDKAASVQFIEYVGSMTVRPKPASSRVTPAMLAKHGATFSNKPAGALAKLHGSDATMDPRVDLVGKRQAQAMRRAAQPRHDPDDYIDGLKVCMPCPTHVLCCQQCSVQNRLERWRGALPHCYLFLQVACDLGIMMHFQPTLNEDCIPQDDRRLLMMLGNPDLVDFCSDMLTRPSVIGEDCAVI